MDLSLLRDENLLQRFKELTMEYSSYTDKLEEFLKEYQKIRLELLLIEDEIGKRKNNKKEES